MKEKSKLNLGQTIVSCPEIVLHKKEKDKRIINLFWEDTDKKHIFFIISPPSGF